MRKVRLELDSVHVESFATARSGLAQMRGTMRAHEEIPTGTLTQACPTNYCATVPVTCATDFAPQCTGTTCTA
jgi:hypothetical protein